MLNEGQFAGTGGWVLKPQGYRGKVSGEELASDESQAEAGKYTSLNLKIEVLAAQDLPLPKDESKPSRIHP